MKHLQPNQCYPRATVDSRDFRLIEEIFHAARQLDGPSREALLADRCGNASTLRSNVLALLAADQQTEGWLDRPLFDVAPELVQELAKVPELMPRAVAFQPGDQIKHYELIRILGQGGMGTVFLARDNKLGRLCAIKLLQDDGKRTKTRLLVEARATAQCKHDNIVVIHEVDEIHECPYMVLEYIQGRTLRLAMQEQGSAFPVRRVIDLVLPIVRALRCAHGHGIVHRDLKPENIILADTGSIKVLDFGIARNIDSHVHTDRLSREILGTLPYMSPEQWRGEMLDGRSDIFALGIILFELFKGHHPLAPLNRQRLAQASDLETAMPPAMNGIPRGSAAFRLAVIVDRCLKKRPDERFGTAEELLQELSALVSEPRAHLAAETRPFVGLGAFQEQDAARFFGRDDEIAAMLAKLRQQALITLAGRSGAGKSSFVRAGVIPAWKQSGKNWETLVMRPGRHPLQALARTLVESGADTDLHEQTVVDTLRLRPGHLGELLRARCRHHGPQAKILLFVDQFEEIHTICEDSLERDIFVACVEGVADDASSPLRAILATRSDFLDHIAIDRRLAIEMTRGLMLLPPMTRDGLRLALVRPVEEAGHRFEDVGMVDELLDTLSSGKNPLPLLQFTADELWKTRDQERRLLTRARYDELGGVAGALSTHANAIVEALSKDERAACRTILLRLLTPERTRKVVALGELLDLFDTDPATAGRANAERVIAVLADARLLLIEKGSALEERTVELVHDSLVERWDKLAEWMDETRQDARFLARLSAAAEQWSAAHEADGLIWRDKPAEEAKQWLERYRKQHGRTSVAAGGVLGGREERYLEAVVATHDRSQKRLRRMVLGGFTVLGVAVLVVTQLAIRAQQEAHRASEQAIRADEERTHARDEAARAERESEKSKDLARAARNATRMASAREHVDDPTTVLALVREVEPPDPPRGFSALARRALADGVARAVLTFPNEARRAFFSPDGQHVVVAYLDPRAAIFRADGSTEPVTFLDHGQSVGFAAYSPDGTHVVTASRDNTARVFPVNGRTPPVVLRGHHAWVTSVAWRPDGKYIATASLDKTARISRADGEGEPTILQGHRDALLSVAWSPDGRFVVTGGADKAARIFRADGKGPSTILSSHDNYISSVAFSPDGTHILTASWDGTARIHAADGQGEPAILKAHGDPLFSAAYSPDGKFIVTAGREKVVRVWDAATHEPVFVLRGHQDAVISAAYSPDGRSIVTASADKTVRFWSIENDLRPVILRGHREMIHSIAWSPDGTHLATASSDGTLRISSADGQDKPRVLGGHEGPIHHVAFSPDGLQLVTACWDEKVRVFPVRGGDAAKPVTLRGHRDKVYAAAWSPDGTRVVSASLDKTAQIYRADGSGEAIVLRGHQGFVHDAEWSPDGEHVLTASWDKTARIFRADGSGEPKVLGGHGGVVHAAAWSPDGKRVVTACEDHEARVFDTAGTAEPQVLHGHAGPVYFASWSPDGQFVVTASSDRTARVWPIDGQGSPVVLGGHDDQVRWARFSPDGRRVLTQSDDHRLRIFSIDGEFDPIVLIGAPHAIHAARWSPDGARVAAAFADRTTWIWGNLFPLGGAQDLQLWTATTYCMSERWRIDTLGVSNELAHVQHEECLRRVAKARTAGPE